MSSFAGDGVFHFIGSVNGNLANLLTNRIPVTGGPAANTVKYVQSQQ